MIFESLLSGIASTSSQSVIAGQGAARAEAAAKAGALRSNASLLRLDAANLRTTGADVFRSEVRQGLQRTGSAGSQYVAGGVTLSGSAGAVLSDITRESQKEAAAQRNQYEFAARKSAMQADIADYQANLEIQAGEFQAQSIFATAANNFEAAKYNYIAANMKEFKQAEASLRAFTPDPWGSTGGRGVITSYDTSKERQTVSQFRDVLGTTFGGGQSTKLADQLTKSILGG